MDANWSNVAEAMGYTANIVGQNFLDDYANFSSTDVIILSSGLIDIPDTRKANILQFVQNGGNVYIQSEYLLELPGNATFKFIAESLGNSFEWHNEFTGNLNPMNITGSLAEGLNEASSISYYWYGTNGSGDDNFIPFLEYDNKSWGFIYCPSDITYGRVITTSDQDWIRTSNNNGLMENILKDLANNIAGSNLPTVSIEMTSQPCDDTYTFTASIANYNSGLELQWTINGEIVEDENELIYSSTTLIDGDVVEARVELSHLCANYNHVSNPILIAPIFPTETPEVTINVDNTDFCQGQTATFTASTTQTADATNISYQWLVNGLPFAGATVQTFSSDQLNDQDLISLEFSYDDDCVTEGQVLSNEVIVNVTPLVNPVLEITADLNEICIGEMVTFSATGTDLGANPVYQWALDGNEVGANSSTLSLNNILNGQTITCSIAIEELCSTTNEANSNTISITVNEIVNPSIEIVASTDATCSGEMVTITAVANDFGTNPTFQWQIDGLNVGTNQPNYSTSSLEDGQQITCTLSVSESCASSAVVTSAPISVVVNESLVPTLSISSTMNTVCPGQSVNFTATGDNHGGNPVYEWFIDGVSVGNNSTAFLLENVNLAQEVSCTVINDENCVINPTTSNAIMVNITSIAIEVLELASENCNDADGLIEVTANGGNAPYTFTWSTGNTETLLTDLQAGIYTLLVTDAQGCTTEKDIELENSLAPQINEILISEVDCSGDNGGAEVILENASLGTKYQWTNASGEVVSIYPKAQNLLPGTYEIAVTNEHGCELVQTVIIESVSVLSVEAIEDTRLELGTSIQLDAIVNTFENVTYEWYPAEGLSCTDCANPTADPTSTINYTVIATNENGCTDSDEVLVHVIPRDDIFIPNAFSPNGDGVNDYFTAFGGSNIAQVKTLRVFNRWGAEVFANQDFSVNVETEGWNGTFKGKVMEPGVYVYYVEVVYINGAVKIKKGDLSITK